MRHGVGCADNQHCCPHDAPVCDTDKGVCMSEDGTKTVPWTTKVPASYTDSPKPLPEEDDVEDEEYAPSGDEEYVPSGEMEMDPWEAAQRKQHALMLGDAAAADQAEGMAVV